jgi:hypothetical protein
MSKRRWAVVLVVAALLTLVAVRAVRIWHAQQQYENCLQMLKIVQQERRYEHGSGNYVLDEMGDAMFQGLYIHCERCRDAFAKSLTFP